MDTLVGEREYSYWEIGDELPFSSSDVSANLNYFKSSDISRLRAQDILIDADNKGKWKRRCPV